MCEWQRESEQRGCGGLKERREYDGGKKGWKGEEEEREAYETFL